MDQDNIKKIIKTQKLGSYRMGKPNIKASEIGIHFSNDEWRIYQTDSVFQYARTIIKTNDEEKAWSSLLDALRISKHVTQNINSIQNSIR